jgi:hypothetical protein
LLSAAPFFAAVAALSFLVFEAEVSAFFAAVSFFETCFLALAAVDAAALVVVFSEKQQ